MRHRRLGVRGRLLVALVCTSVVTLGVAALALVGPLTERLRDQNVANLRNAGLQARPGFERALGRRAGERRQALQRQGLDLQSRANARVLVFGRYPASSVAYDTDIGAPTDRALLAALGAQRTKGTLIDVQDDDVTIAIRLFSPSGVLVTQRPLSDVATAVQQVRNALLTAGGVGLLVAVLLSVGISRTLLRRLERLRRTAMRITVEGPDAPPPHDDGRDEVGDLARAFARMQEALRREEQSRRSFVATASHELRTPLTMLQGTMELLEEDLGGRHVDLVDAQAQVASARTELRRLSSLAEELLDLSRLDAQVPLRSEPVELGELARAVAAEFALRARERGVEIEVAPPPGESWAMGDPDAVARTVRILVDNAMRHGPRGEPIRVAVGADARTTIEVADRGRGVLPQDRERIFERFYRSESGTLGGFGLGLAIGRGLAERMRGSLTLASGDGVGAHFVLSLPAARGQAPVAEPEVSSSPA